jgi:hypothetical protein
MASEWIGVFGTLVGGALAAGGGYMGQLGLLKRQDALRRQDTRSEAYLAFLTALQICFRKFEIGLLQSTSGNLDFSSDQVRSDWYKEFAASPSLRDLDTSLQKVELFGNKEVRPRAAKLCHICAAAISTQREDLRGILHELNVTKDEMIDRIQLEQGKH